MNLPLDASKKQIKRIFSTFGEVRYVQLFMDTSGKSKGKAFVCMETTEACEHAIEDMNLKVKIEGSDKLLVVEYASESRQKKIKNKEMPYEVPPPSSSSLPPPIYNEGVAPFPYNPYPNPYFMQHGKHPLSLSLFLSLSLSI